MKEAKVTLLPGDGIGPEITREARRILETAAKSAGTTLHIQEALIGGAAIDATGDPLPEETLNACHTADAVFLGAVGGPKWSDPNAKVRPEQGLLRLRQALGVFANLRPIQIQRALIDAAPIKRELLEGVDFVVVRELTGGIYFGQPRFRDEVDGQRRAVDTMVYTEEEIRRVVRLAFEIARGRRKRVTSVDKANVLDVSRLWRQIAEEVASDYPDVTLEHHLVDSAAMRIITHARDFDVIVTGNLFGDILTDEAAVLSGSLGVLPSASLSAGTHGLFEPIHGSAPDIAGQNIANPLGSILSMALLCRYSLGLDEAATAIEKAVTQALNDGCRTRDLGGELSTEAMGQAVIERLA